MSNIQKREKVTKMNKPLQAVPDLGNATISVNGNKVRIDKLEINNADLAAHISAKEGQEQVIAFIELIEFALSVNKLANVAADVRELESVAKRVESKLDEAGDEAFKELESLIKKQGDETSPEALISILKTKLIQKIVDDLDPNKAGSPFKEIHDNLLELLKKSGAKAESKLGTKHGRDFNKTMDAIVQDLARQTGDAPLYTNDIESESGSKVGDEVITIDTNFTGGATINTVWEFKAVKRQSMPDVLEEISEAMTNRHAQAGVFVLARTEHNATWARFTAHPGRRAVIIVDEDNVDELLVHYAHIWARVEAVRSLGNIHSTIDFDRLLVAIEEAETALEGFSQVTKAHTEIQSSLDTGVEWLEKSKKALKSKFIEIKNISRPGLDT